MRLVKYIVVGALAPIGLLAFMIFLFGAFGAFVTLVSGLVGVSQELMSVLLVCSIGGAIIGVLVYHDFA